MDKYRSRNWIKKIWRISYFYPNWTPNMESLTLRKSSSWFLTGAALVNTVVFSFIILCLTFILGHGLGAWQFPLAFILAIFLNYFASRYFFPGEYKRVFILSIT